MCVSIRSTKRSHSEPVMAPKLHNRAYGFCLNKQQANLLFYLGVIFSKPKKIITYLKFARTQRPLNSLSATGCPSSLHERGRDSCLRAVLCYKRLYTKACMGCKLFFLKERKNVMFLNKIDLPYCLQWNTKIALTHRKRFKTA